MAVNCFMCCLTSLQRAGSVRRSASRNFGVLHSTASVQNRDESASRSASPPRAAASTSLRAALASGVVFVRLTRRAGGVIGDATGRGLQPRRGGGEGAARRRPRAAPRRGAAAAQRALRGGRLAAWLMNDELRNDQPQSTPIHRQFTTRQAGGSPLGRLTELLARLEDLSHVLLWSTHTSLPPLPPPA